ncbi:DUF4468 domain-containing protein [Mucilaginibacter sp.]|uniref:DUF4468 domain-containing protein n=1 Tax=Mucilaginibacter sp. TaxID=1882438 RepID=UPI003B00DBCB
MKKCILTWILAMVFFASKSQNMQPPIDSTTHKITYQNIIHLADKKDVLYDKGLNWFAIAFKSSNDVIQIKDKENGKIVGKYLLQPYEPKFGFVSATVTLLFKENKYKYIITDLNYQGSTVFSPWTLEEDPKPGKVGMTKWGQQKVKENTYIQIEKLIENLKIYMNSKNQESNF